MENTNSEIKESDQESSIDKANALNRLAHVLSICNIFFCIGLMLLYVILGGEDIQLRSLP